MLKFYIEADGASEEKIMAIADVLQQIKDLAVDTTAVEAKFAAESEQIQAVFSEFKTESASLRATIADLRTQIASGGGVTETDLLQVLDALRARDDKIIAKADEIFTPEVPVPEGEAPAPPAGPGE